MVNKRVSIYYILLMAVAFGLLFYGGIIRPWLPLMRGEAIAAAYYDLNLFIGEKIPPPRYYATSWGDADFAVGILFLALGTLCFILGIVRALNKLNCWQMCLIAASAILFALMTLTMTDFAEHRYLNESRFYVFWFAFFGYPAFLLWHFFDCQRPTLRRWLWPPLVLAAAYALAAICMYFLCALPFDMTERPYTYMTAGGVTIYLMTGALLKKDKTTAFYMRSILALGALWGIRILLMTLNGSSFSIHNEYKSFFLIVLLFMVGFALYADIRELATYKGDIRMLEMKNEYMLENYQSLELHHQQIAEMKHETRHHFLILRELCEGGEHERLLKYLKDIQGGFEKIEEPVACDNPVIQAILGHAARQARELSFDISFDIMPLPALEISDADLVSLLMNLLDNALEANARLEDAGGRFISVRLRPRPPYLCLAVANACQGGAEKAEGLYKSTKDDPLLHGHGLAAVRSITHKYDGIFSFEHKGDTFNAEIVLSVIAP